MTQAKYLLLLWGILFSLGLTAQINDGAIRQPPELLSPYNKEVVQIERPLLTWKAPLPMLSNQVRYSLKLVELRNGQKPIQALQSNIPIIQNRSIPRTFLPYPVSVQGLEVGKTYAWQVLAYQNGSLLGQTDIWIFTYQLEKSVLSPPPVVSYPFVKTRIEDTHYQIQDTLRFAYDNHFNESELDYELLQEGKAIESPTIPLSVGINKIKLGLSDLQTATYYVLVIKNKAQQRYYLPFIYNNTVNQ